MSYSIIPQQINVDEETIDFNVNREIEVIADNLGKVLYEGSPNNNLISWTADKYKRLKIYMTVSSNSGGTSAQWIINGITSTDYNFRHIQNNGSTLTYSNYAYWRMQYFQINSGNKSPGVFEISTQNGVLFSNGIYMDDANNRQVHQTMSIRNNNINYINSLKNNGSSSHEFHIKIVGFEN